MAFGLRGKERAKWDPELLDAPGKFYLQARLQGLTGPRPARGFWIPTEQVGQVAAHYARQPVELDAPSARAAAQHSPPRRIHLVPPTPPSPPVGAGGWTPPTGGPSPDPPTPGGPAATPPSPGAWAPPPDPRPGGDPTAAALATMRAALHTAGPRGATVAELVDQIGLGQSRTYELLQRLRATGEVERAADWGRWRLTTPGALSR